MTNRTAAPVDRNHTTSPGLTKRGLIGDIEAHWQFVLEESVCGDFGAVCFSPQGNLWVDYYAYGATSPSKWEPRVSVFGSQMLTICYSLLLVLGYHCRRDQQPAQR